MTWTNRQLIELYHSWGWRLCVRTDPNAVIPAFELDDVDLLTSLSDQDGARLMLRMDNIAEVCCAKKSLHGSLEKHPFLLGALKDTVYLQTRFENPTVDGYYRFFYRLPTFRINVQNSLVLHLDHQGVRFGKLCIAQRYSGASVYLPDAQGNSSVYWVGDILDGPSMIPQQWLMAVSRSSHGTVDVVTECDSYE